MREETLMRSKRVWREPQEGRSWRGGPARAQDEKVLRKCRRGAAQEELRRRTSRSAAGDAEENPQKYNKEFMMTRRRP